MVRCGGRAACFRPSKRALSMPDLCPCTVTFTSASQSFSPLFPPSREMPRVGRPGYFTSSRLLQFSSVAQSCPTLCYPIDCSTPGFPVHHQLLELTQTHVYQVGDAIQPSHRLSSPSPPVPNPSQHQSLFQ